MRFEDIIVFCWDRDWRAGGKIQVQNAREAKASRQGAIRVFIIPDAGKGLGLGLGLGLGH
jgi:hypothetical protein